MPNLKKRIWGSIRTAIMMVPLLIQLAVIRITLVFICARARRTLRRYSQ